MLSSDVGTRNIIVIETDKNREAYTLGYFRIMIQCMSHIYRISSKIAPTDLFYFSLSLTTLCFFFGFFVYLFFYLFIFGCVGSSFLCEGFL